MTPETKQEISQAVKIFAESKKISLNEIARRSGVNSATVSQIANGKLEIKDHWFTLVAEFIGYHNGNSLEWPHVNTPQFKSIVTHLDDARRTGQNRTIIGETGCGKTYAINKYVRANPSNTFRITVSALHNLMAIINDIIDQVGLDNIGLRPTKVRNVARRFKYYRNEGMQPLLIIDEAENLNTVAFGMLKSLYDQMEGVCPIVLVGTGQLTRRIERMVTLNKVGMPQFQRRFKAGTRKLPVVDKNFREFLDGVEDARLVKALRRVCRNYGELHDYMTMARQEATRMRKPLTLEIFEDATTLKLEDYRW